MREGHLGNTCHHLLTNIDRVQALVDNTNFGAVHSTTNAGASSIYSSISELIIAIDRVWNDDSPILQLNLAINRIISDPVANQNSGQQIVRQVVKEAEALEDLRKRVWNDLRVLRRSVGDTTDTLQGLKRGVEKMRATGVEY